MTYFSLCSIGQKKPKKIPAFHDGLGNIVYRSRHRRLIRVQPAPFNSEAFHARLLLLEGRSLATSWSELRTVDGEILPTYAAATQKRGLLLDHHTAELTFQDALASELTTPCRARVLLLAVRLLLPSTSILSTLFPLSTFSHPPACALQIFTAFECDAAALIDTFSSSLLEPQWLQLPDPEQHAAILGDLQRRLAAHHKSLQDYGIVPPVPNPEPAIPVDPDFLPDRVTLDIDQQAIFDAVVAHVAQTHPKQALFLHVEGQPGGGKSFLLNVCLNHTRSLGHVAIPAAFPAKVARKFAGGETAHFCFAMRPSQYGDTVQLDVQVPPPVPARRLTRLQALGRHLAEARLIFVDEITMMRSDELDAIHSKLRDLNFRGVFLIVGNSAQLGAVLIGDSLPLLAP